MSGIINWHRISASFSLRLKLGCFFVLRNFLFCMWFSMPRKSGQSMNGQEVIRTVDFWCNGANQPSRRVKDGPSHCGHQIALVSGRTHSSHQKRTELGEDLRSGDGISNQMSTLYLQLQSPAGPVGVGGAAHTRQQAALFGQWGPHKALQVFYWISKVCATEASSLNCHLEKQLEIKKSFGLVQWPRTAGTGKTKNVTQDRQNRIPSKNFALQEHQISVGTHKRQTCFFMAPINSINISKYSHLKKSFARNLFNLANFWPPSWVCSLNVHQSTIQCLVPFSVKAFSQTVSLVLSRQRKTSHNGSPAGVQKTSEQNPRTRENESMSTSNRRWEN